MVVNAESPEEIEEIERSVQRGILPKQKSNRLEMRQENSTQDVNGRKRPLVQPENEQDNLEGTNASSGKKIKT